MNALIAPPLPRPFLTAGWHHLVMLNFEAAPELLAPYVAPGLELDFHEGRTFVSVVGFRFMNTRVFGLSLPWHRHFDEVNLRFYVKRMVHGELRRGVTFIKELAPRRLVSWVARTFYNENYTTVPLQHAIDLPVNGTAGHVEYRWELAGRPHRLGAHIHGMPQPPAPGSEAEFIVEHYWGYSRQRDGATLEYRVEHPPWRVWPTDGGVFEGDAAALYGPPFAEMFQRQPSSALVAEGSTVLVRRGARLA
jgi:uncharacterized protein YqjF (DUF2071 family)